MVPTPADIARYRHVAAAVVRGVGLLMLIYAAGRLGGYLWNNFDGISRQFSSPVGMRGVGLRRYVGSMIFPAVLLASSIVAIGWPRWIARLLVPARVRPACPGCGFSLKGLRSETCPECGLWLGPAFLNPADQSGRVRAKAEDSDSE